MVILYKKSIHLLKELLIIGFSQAVYLLSAALFLTFISTNSTSVFSLEISLVTEEYPPYYYLENNKVIGISAEITGAVSKEARIPYTITLYPWARAYAMALHNRNVLIFSLARSPDREDLFKWVGVIASGQFCLFSLKKRTDIVAKISIKVHKYR